MKEKTKETRKITFVKILNILFTIVSVTAFFLILVTAGAMIKAMDETLLVSAVSKGHDIGIFGALYAAIMAIAASVVVGMLLVPKKNVAEIFSIIANVAFLGFLAVYFTVNISGFVLVFSGLSLAFSILMAIFLVPKTEDESKK